VAFVPMKYRLLEPIGPCPDKGTGGYSQTPALEALEASKGPARQPQAPLMVAHPCLPYHIGRRALTQRRAGRGHPAGRCLSPRHPLGRISGLG
jgi:hypothetical protein